MGVVLFAVAGPIHGEVHEERGEVMTAILVFYSLSSIISGEYLLCRMPYFYICKNIHFVHTVTFSYAIFSFLFNKGYTSGSYFKLYYATTPSGRAKTGSTAGGGGGATQWQLTMLLTVLLLPVILGSVLGVLNSIALFYGTIFYVPFLVMLKIFFLWVFVSVPLCILGTLLGRHAKLGGKTSDPFPCRVNAIPRPIPEDVPWYGVPANLIVSRRLSFLFRCSYDVQKLTLIASLAAFCRSSLFWFYFHRAVLHSDLSLEL